MLGAAIMTMKIEFDTAIFSEDIRVISFGKANMREREKYEKAQAAD